MKKTQKLSLGLLLMTITIALFGFQKKDVPENVLSTFKKMFPTANKIDWSKESETEWEAEFQMNSLEYSANFLENGTWIETEHELKKKDIPKNIIESITSQFPGYEIEEAELSETKDGIVYEFEIEKGESELEVTYSKEGKFIKKEEIQEED